MNSENRPKLCECGCGEPAPIARMTNAALGYVKGRPMRFVNGHQNRGRTKKTYTPLEDRYAIVETGFGTACWIWIMSLDGRGYAQMWDTRTRRLRRAHRVYYEVFVGPIPDGLHIDHLCRVTNCVNPAHLEPVTHRENLMRGAKVIRGLPIRRVVKMDTSSRF